MTHQLEGSMEIQHIGYDKAMALYKSEWWKGLAAHRIVGVQLFVAELCMPFGEYLDALADTLNRPVYTHELGSANYDRLVAEFQGDKPAPTMQEIIDLIPAEKRIVWSRP